MPAKPIIYQLVVRYFGNTNGTNRPNGDLATNGCGKFADINAAALRAIRELGATHVWLTGVLRQATLTDYSTIGLPPDDPDVVKGIAGSFYAVRDYFDVCPDYATHPSDRLAEFDALLRRIHAAGLKALIDFVPNHVARGYASVVRPDVNFGIGDDVTQFFSRDNHFFYVTDHPGEALSLSRPAHWNPEGFDFDGRFAREDGSPGRPVKVTGDNSCTTAVPVEAWYETVKLNYGYDFIARTGHYVPRPRTWDLMDEILAYWQARGVDGFRCDFAHFIPAEAWEFLIGRARDRDPSAYFFAEAYPWEGSGDPIERRQQLIDVGFDAVYNDGSYDALKKIYLGRGTQDDYHHAIGNLSAAQRAYMVQYMENHDERRIASPINPSATWTGNSGFGSADAGYLLAPLQYLCAPGPVLMLNGQEIGEPGADAEGFSGRDGRTTVFDYWCMPDFQKWVSDRAYDGSQLAPSQKQLRNFYAALFALCHDPAVCGAGYWGLKYFNRPDVSADCPDSLYTFAKFDEQSGRMLLIAANFDTVHAQTGRVRLPPELADLCFGTSPVSVRLCLDRTGARDELLGFCSSQDLVSNGIDLQIPPQTAQVYRLEPRGTEI